MTDIVCNENSISNRVETGTEAAITYFGDVWISCTRSRLSDVDGRSLGVLGSINLPLGILHLVFPRILRKCGPGLEVLA